MKSRALCTLGKLSTAPDLLGEFFKLPTNRAESSQSQAESLMSTLATGMKSFVMVLAPGSQPSFGISGHTLQVWIIYKPRGGVSWDYQSHSQALCMGSGDCQDWVLEVRAGDSLLFLSFQLPGVCWVPEDNPEEGRKGTFPLSQGACI